MIGSSKKQYEHVSGGEAYCAYNFIIENNNCEYWKKKKNSIGTDSGLAIVRSFRIGSASALYVLKNSGLEPL